MVTLGHASISEKNTATGGKAGDQTKQEVCIRKYYIPTTAWDVVLRPKNKTLAEKSATFVEDVCANGLIGYDQGGRNSLYKQAKLVNFDGAKITTPCECDCSSFMHVAAIAGGANLSYGSNGLTTRTMRNGFRKSGDYEVLTDKKYLTSDKYLRRGDILVNEGYHTVMVLSDGELAYEKETNTTTESYIAKTTGKLNLRSSASSKNSTNILTVLPKDHYVCVLNEDNDTTWVQVQTIVKGNSYIGYVSKKYLKAIDISKNEVRVTTGSLNVRTGQTTTFSKLFTMKKNDSFIVIDKDKWGLIFCKNKLGYASLSSAYSKTV